MRGRSQKVGTDSRGTKVTEWKFGGLLDRSIDRRYVDGQIQPSKRKVAMRSRRLVKLKILSLTVLTVSGTRRFVYLPRKEQWCCLAHEAPQRQGRNANETAADCCSSCSRFLLYSIERAIKIREGFKDCYRRRFDHFQRGAGSNPPIFRRASVCSGLSD